MKFSMIRAPRTRIVALMLALGLAVPSAPAQLHAQLPALGDAGDLSVSTERRIGDRVARELFRDPDYLDDAILSDYLDSLWQPLLAAARQRGDLGPELDQRYAWRLLLGRDRTINAFAVPGGWMGVHLGLIAATTSRDELASVLAHELTHVTQRHISRMVSQDKRQTPWLLAAMVLGALAASRSPDAASAMITGGQAIAIQNQLSFSRDMEREADRIGFAVMTQAGFAPQGFASMFEKLQQASRLNDTGNYPYLRTHPLTTERVADMRSRTQLGERLAPLPPDLLHSMMAGRARGLSATGVDRQRALVQEAQSQRADPPAARLAGALYAGVVAASRLREPAQARALYARLVPLAGSDETALRAVRLLDGELALAESDASRAAADASGGPVGARPEMLLGVRATLLAGKPAEAASRLQTWVALQPQDATAWQLLAQASQAQGQQLRALRAEAEAQVAMLDYSAALDRLRAAQALARQPGADHFEASIIDTRARQLESTVREQALER